MPQHQIIVTDVTRYGALFCVAGFDPQNGRMVRPEPPSATANGEASRFWSAQQAGPGRLFAAGNVVSFEANAAPANFPFPHASEDCVVTANSPGKILGQIAFADLPAAVAASTSATLADAFDGGLIRPFSGKAFVPGGHQGRSLGAINLPANNIAFHINHYDPAKPKLPAYLTEHGVVYDVPVTSDAANALWRAQGLDALSASIAHKPAVHLRVGLARPFAGRGCYLQVNGIY